MDRTGLPNLAESRQLDHDLMATPLEPVRAVVRIRPLNDYERQQGCTPIIESLDGNHVRMRPGYVRHRFCLVACGLRMLF
jgi:hypothetical protein